MVWRHEHSSVGGADHFRQGTRRAGDHRGSARHRFDGRQSESLVAGRHDHERGALVAPDEFVVVDSTRDVKAVRAAQSLRYFARGVFRVIVIDEGEPEVVWEPRE